MSEQPQKIYGYWNKDLFCGSREPEPPEPLKHPYYGEAVPQALADALARLLSAQCGDEWDAGEGLESMHHAREILAAWEVMKNE